MIDGNGIPEIVGQAPALRRAVELARRFAPTGMPILLVGATGTGKDLLARAIHCWSARRGRLVDVNCGGLPRELVDSLLFGHRRGVFTGAVETVSGLIEDAHEGTLFLDELCSLSPEAQVKLLRVLESGEVRRLGETDVRAVKVRVVAAVRDGVDQLIRQGLFRLDLYQRLAGVVLDLPALCDRGADVVALAEHFASQHQRRLGLGAGHVLLGHEWSGNVREVRVAVQRAAFLTADPELDGAVMAEAIELGLPKPSVGCTGRGIESNGPAVDRQRLLAAFELVGWHAGRAAQLLGIGRTTLFRRCRALGLSVRQKRAASTTSAAGVPAMVELWNSPSAVASEVTA